MKKFLLAALLCISVNGFAQLIQFGPQFSYNITSPLTNDFSSKSSGTGMGVAGFARVKGRRGKVRPHRSAKTQRYPWWLRFSLT